MRQVGTLNLYAILLILGIAPLFRQTVNGSEVALRPADILLVIFVVAIIALWLYEKRIFESTYPRPLLLFILLLFAIWTTTSLLNSIVPLLTLRRILRIYLLLIVTAGILSLRPSLMRVAQCLSLHLLLQSAVTIFIFLRENRETDELYQYVLGENVLQIGDQVILRGQGLTEHPNLLAILLVTSLFVILAGLPRHTGGQQAYLIFVVTMGIVALFFTFSRAAAAGCILALIYLISQTVDQIKASLTKRSNLIAAVGLLLVGLTLVVIYRDVLLSRLVVSSSALEITSVWERSVHNRVALAMIQDNPLIGVGARNAQFLFTDYFLDDVSISTIIHSTVMLISAELGLPGGILWLTILLYPIAYAIRNRQRLSLRQHALTAALIPYLIVDWTSPAAWDAPVGSLLRWLLLALWMQHVLPTSQPDPDQQPEQQTGTVKQQEII